MSDPRPRAVISGVGHAVPPKLLTNQQLEQMVDTTDEWIRTRTGIVERHISDAETATSDLASEAARAALACASVPAEQVDFVLVATATADMCFPSTASITQHAIGATRAGACDLSAGCSGFVYGVAMAAKMIEGGLYRRILVIGADTLTKIVDWTDRNTCVLFGDGAGAVLLEASYGEAGVMTSVLGSDGSGAETLCVPAGGSRRPASHETVERRQHFLRMAGGEVFKFAVKVVSESSLEALRQAGLTVDDVTLMIPHQANARIIEAAAKRLGIPLARTVVNVERFGNTSCASIPIALSEACSGGRLKSGDLVLMCGFGAGLSWASTVVRWGEVVPAATGC